jgi:hypothetical protein
MQRDNKTAIMPRELTDVFKEVYTILAESEKLFLAKGYKSPFTAYLDYQTWRIIQQYIQSNRIGSMGNSEGIMLIRYQNWKIFGQAELKNEIIMHPGERVHRQLSRE